MQSLAVSLIVAGAAGYVAWLLAPQAMRRWLIGRLPVAAPSRRAWLARLEASAAKGACSSCAACAAGAPDCAARRSPAEANRQRLPVTRIG